MADVGDDLLLGELTPITTLTSAVIDDPYLEQSFFLDSILGVQCDPWGSDDNFDVYFTVSYTFWIEAARQGPDVAKYMPYLAAVVKLNSADDFSTMEWVVTGLPVSGFDHAVNGLDFLHDHRLLICVGGQTNAGWPSSKYGGMFESALTAAVLAADVSKPDFNGNIQYELLPDAPEVHPYYGQLPAAERLPGNQRWGDWARKTDEDDITFYVTGTRNPFDVYVAPSELVYSQDNGPNKNFGGAVEGYDTAKNIPKLRPGSIEKGGDEVSLGDEVNLLVEGQWYGHPNVARFRADP